MITLVSCHQRTVHGQKRTSMAIGMVRHYVKLFPVSPRHREDKLSIGNTKSCET
jgi:hypothetical protein